MRFREIAPKLGIYWLVVFFLVCTLGKSNELTCERLERHYITCQQERTHFYGLWSEPTVPFRIKGAEVKEEMKRDSEGGTYYIYKLFINTENEEFYFHDYGKDYDKAYADLGRLLDFFSGADREPVLNLKRRTILF